MSKKYSKPSDFKIDPNKTKTTKCNCIGNRKISKQCLIKGICPTLKIISVHKGFRVTVNKKIRKEFEGVENGVDIIVKTHSR